MKQDEVLAMIADHDAKLKPYQGPERRARPITRGGKTYRNGEEELMDLAEALHHNGLPIRAQRLREYAREYGRMEAELNRLFQEAREAHAAVEELKK